MNKSFISVILATKLKYNIEVLTKNYIAQHNNPEAIETNKLHETVMNYTTKGDPLIRI